jgi:hypothetical protein
MNRVTAPAFAIAVVLCLGTCPLASCDYAKADSEPVPATTAGAQPAPETAAAPAEAAPLQLAPNGKPLSRYKGYYVGSFNAEEMEETKTPMYSNKINFSIDAIDGERISGHTVCAGKLRPYGSGRTSVRPYGVTKKPPAVAGGSQWPPSDLFLGPVCAYAVIIVDLLVAGTVGPIPALVFGVFRRTFELLLAHVDFVAFEPRVVGRQRVGQMSQPRGDKSSYTEQQKRQAPAPAALWRSVKKAAATRKLQPASRTPGRVRAYWIEIRVLPRPSVRTSANRVAAFAGCSLTQPREAGPPSRETCVVP